MRKLVLAASAVLVTAFSAQAKGPSNTLTSCICRIHAVIDGKQFPLREGVDFRVRRSPYGEVVVNLRKSIEMDPRWAHARASVSKCLSERGAR